MISNGLPVKAIESLTEEIALEMKLSSLHAGIITENVGGIVM